MYGGHNFDSRETGPKINGWATHRRNDAPSQGLMTSCRVTLVKKMFVYRKFVIDTNWFFVLDIEIVSKFIILFVYWYVND